MSLVSCARRLLEIAAKRQTAHLGSCLSCLPVLYGIYRQHRDDIVILSSGHSGLALYCVLEEVFGHDAEMLFDKHGVHPGYDPDNHIYCSTGSLGCGLAVAVGYALAGLPTHCIVSDGECAEGLVWESLAFASRHAQLPLVIHVNANGYSALGSIDRDTLDRRLRSFFPAIAFHWTSNAPLADDLSAHYQILATPEEADRYAATIC